MFGYVRPALDGLSAEDRDAYKSVYCGLCHTMGKRHGWLSRLTLNYDFTFLAILLLEGNAGSSDLCRCPIHPLRKPRSCVCGSALDLAADQSMILFYHKLCDDIMDKSFFAGLPVRVLRLFVRKAYQKAAGSCAEFDLKVREKLNLLNRLEKERSPQLDRLADTFAALLSSAARSCGDEIRRRATEQLLYHLGRWIYLVDAWDDLDEDEKAGSFNPFQTRFGGNAKQEIKYVETTMTHSLRLAESAANLLEFGPWKELVENMLFRSLPAVQAAVLSGTWKELKRPKRTREKIHS